MLTDATADDRSGQSLTRRQRLARSRFGQWASRRPFLGGALMAAGGIIVTVFPFVPVKSYVTAGVAVGWYDPDVGLKMVHPPLGLAGGLALLVCGALTVRGAGRHHIVGIAGVIAGFISFVLNHLGGLVVGMLLGIVGGALTYAWMPGPHDGGGPDRGDRESLTDPEFFSLVRR